MHLELPTPLPEALQHSEKLQTVIREAIQKNQGRISFEKFMELALYAPQLGYYSAGSEKIGALGDFVTAPHISSLFSYVLAQCCAKYFDAINNNSILEFGAGSGKMAFDILTYLHDRKNIPAHYFILETSADFQQRQRERFEKNAPALLPFVHWLSRLPSKFNGVVLANEVLDALPVSRFFMDPSGIKEYYVTWQQDHFAWIVEPCQSPGLFEVASQIQNDFLKEVEGYTSEINLRARGWINSLNQCMEKGIVLLLDYGFPREVYYHPQRSDGTLMCHYRHRAHPDPLILVGLQDITAHVDFSFVAQCALQAGFTLQEYTTQARFLLNHGMLDLVEQQSDMIRQLSVSREIQTLTMPHEMGELFKVMVLSKGIAA